jgi:hypothetical protein
MPMDGREASDGGRGLHAWRRVALVATWMAAASPAHAQDTGAAAASRNDAAILGQSPTSLRIESVTTRITSFNQFGFGYQSKAGPLPFGPGSERAIILEPQLQVVALQGDRFRHVVTLPVDIVTAASPDAIDSGQRPPDVVSAASRNNVAGTLGWSGTYRVDPASDLTMSAGLHVEEPFRSWHGGISGSHAFAGGDTLVSASLLEVYDWFDRFDIVGHREGRANRSSETASVGVTQVLTPGTVVSANYGLTVQTGELGNTWNSVPLWIGERGAELLPSERVRHAFVARASQFLPWNGALRLYYRLYLDDWGLAAHSVEGQIMQRISRSLYVGALYRLHTQTGVTFFTPLAGPEDTLRTADSDLQRLDSQTIGGKVVLDVPVDAPMRMLHFEVGYERYFRTNNLSMDIVTWETGYRF